MTVAARRALHPDDAWAAGLALVLVVVPIVLGTIVGSTMLSWLVPIVTTAIAVAAFVVRPTRAIVVIALFVLFIDTVAIGAGPRVKAVDEMLVPILGLITVIRQRERIPSLWSWPREIGVALVLAAAVASSLVNAVPLLVWVPGLLLIAKAFGFFYIAILLDIDRDDVAWAMRVVLAVGVVVLALGVVQLVVPSAFEVFGVRAQTERAGLPAIKSIFYHAQLFGWFCGVIALYLFAGHALYRRPWMLILGLVFSVGTVLSARRRAMLGIAGGLLAGLSVAVAAARGRRPAELLRWLPSAVGIVVIAVAFLPALTGLARLAVRDYVEPLPTASGDPGLPDPLPAEPEEVAGTPARIALYQTSLLIARDHAPFGAGLGRFGSWMSRTEYSPVYAEYGLDDVYGLSPQNPSFITDTFWPQVLGEAGGIGVIGYVIFLAAVGLQIVLAYRRRDPTDPLVTLAILGAGMILAQTLIESVASPIFNSPTQIYLVMLAIGGMLGWQARRPDAG